MESKKFSLNWLDLQKIGRGALIALGGALLTYLADALPSVDFGQLQPVVVALGGILINAGWKYLKGLQ